MKKIHHYHRRFRLSLIRAGMLTVIACIFFLICAKIKLYEARVKSA